MICKKCGCELEQNTKICQNCGENIEENNAEEVVNNEVVEEVEENNAEEVVNNEVVEEVSNEPVETEEIKEQVESEEVVENTITSEESQSLDEETTEENSSCEVVDEDKTKFPSDIYSNEFEFTKKDFKKYYAGEFKYRSMGGYITIQILSLFALFIPGVLFAIIYWCISNPITKSSLWKGMLYQNKGNLIIYRFFFTEDTLIIRKNRNEELRINYANFKKIRMNKNGFFFLSKNGDFYLPIEQVKNITEIKEILSKLPNAKIK